MKDGKATGGAPPSDTLLKLVEVLEDGEWHPVADVQDTLGKLMPPGPAMRKAEMQRRHSVRDPQAERMRPRSNDEQITFGRRAHARDAISSVRAYLEFDPPGDRSRSSKVRMAQMPPKVVQWRLLQAEGKAVRTGTVLDDLIASHDPEAMMVDWKTSRLKAVLLQAVKRLQES